MSKYVVYDLEMCIVPIIKRRFGRKLRRTLCVYVQQLIGVSIEVVLFISEASLLI